jgi:hypothetical protein
VRDAEEVQHHARRGLREENIVMRTSMAFALMVAVLLVLGPLTATPVAAQRPPRPSKR